MWNITKLVIFIVAGLVSYIDVGLYAISGNFSTAWAWFGWAIIYTILTYGWILQRESK